MNFQFDVKRPIDVICMGRVAVDLYAEQVHTTLVDAKTLRKYLGGCAGNIAVGTARLGLQSMMFSCVGTDEMGQFLKKNLQQENVRTDLLYETDKHLTGLVLLGICPPRHFPLIFYRNDCADMQLKPEQAQSDLLAQAKTLLITGTGLSTKAMRATTQHTVKLAKQLGTAIIIDLDFRPVLWGLTALGDGETRYKSSAEVTAQYQAIIPACDLIVGTEEEICIAGGQENIAAAIDALRQQTPAPIVVKNGERGCQVFLAKQTTPLSVRAFPVEVLNVLGAGDAFISGLLRGLLRGESWETAMTYANAAGALVVTRHGCAPAMPNFVELTYFINEYDHIPAIWLSEPLRQLHDTAANFSNNPLAKQGHFHDGKTQILSIDNDPEMGMNFFCYKLRMGEQISSSPAYESAYLLMTGKIEFRFLNAVKTVERTGYFEEKPIVLHCPAYTQVDIHALTDCEILVIETPNENHFDSMLFDANNLLEAEQRGQGLLNDVSYREVRTVFDKRNRPFANLVLGEIITFQGHWSSAPSHHHPQPEVYHYRFSEPQGFAFGEYGEEVIKIHHNDTYKIRNGMTHAHSTAPGYALYTLWFIRHLPDAPYHAPVFCAEHEWARHSTANLRTWKRYEEIK